MDWSPDEWSPDDVDIPQPLADLFSNPAPPSTSSGTTGVRRFARLSRALVPDYIAATAERNADGDAAASSSRASTAGSAAAVPLPASALSLNQFLGPPPQPAPAAAAAASRPPSRRLPLEHPRLLSLAGGTGDRDRARTADNRTWTLHGIPSADHTARPAVVRSIELGMSLPNAGIERDRDRDRDRDLEHDLIFLPDVPWQQSANMEPRTIRALQQVRADLVPADPHNIDVDLEAAEVRARVDTAHTSNTSPETEATAAATASAHAAAIADTTHTLTAASSSRLAPRDRERAETDTAAAEPGQGLGPASRARRTILQDAAPRPGGRTSSTAPQIVPSGNHWSWVSYASPRSSERTTTAAASVTANNASGGSNSGVNSNSNSGVNSNNNSGVNSNSDTNSNTDPNNRASSRTPSDPTTQPPLATVSTTADAPVATGDDTVSDPATAIVDSARDRLIQQQRMSIRSRRRLRDPTAAPLTTVTTTATATAILPALRPRRYIYQFDPTDISPPGGADDHIWDMLRRSGSDSEDSDGGRGAVVIGGRVARVAAAAAGAGALEAPRDPLYLDGWGTAPDTGAALSRGRFNRRRQSFRASRDLHDWDSEEVSVAVAPRPASALPPTNVGPLFRAPQPVVVGSASASTGERTRRRSDDEPAADDTAAKRQKRTPPPAVRPTYLSYTSLPASAPLPSAFNTPDSRSHLEVSDTPDGRPVVTFSATSGHAITGGMEDSCSLRTTQPIPSGIGVFYFEAEVLCTGKGANITLGFMLPHTSLRRLVGWDKGTWGWHGDDGKIFNQAGDGSYFSEPWTENETVGLGIDYTTSRAFLTRNGKLLGHAFVNLPQGLHVAVGMQGVGESVAFTFAGPWKYDIDAHVARVRAQVCDALTPPPVVFSGDKPPEVEGRVPRLAGIAAAPPQTPLGVGIGVDKGKGRKHEVALPDTSPLRGNASARAQAALVLDYLATQGHSRVLAMLKAKMAERGVLPAAGGAATFPAIAEGTGTDPDPDLDPFPRLPADVNSPVSAYPSPAAAIAALSAALSAEGTPRMPLRLLRSLDLAGLDAGVARRLQVYEFAGEVAATTSDEAMDVDDVGEAESALAPASKSDDKADDGDKAPAAGEADADDDGDAPMDDDTASDTSDGETRLLARARALRATALTQHWAASDLALIDAASGLLVGGLARARAAQTLASARLADTPAVVRAARRGAGIRERSLLESAVRQTALVGEVLGNRGVGEAAFVGVENLLGDGKGARTGERASQGTGNA